MNSNIIKVSEEKLRESLVNMLLESAEEAQRTFQKTGHLRLLRNTIDYGLTILARDSENPQARYLLIKNIPEYLKHNSSKTNEHFRQHIETLYYKLYADQAQTS